MNAETIEEFLGFLNRPLYKNWVVSDHLIRRLRNDLYETLSIDEWELVEE